MPVVCLNTWKSAAAPSISLVQQAVGTSADGSSQVTINFDTPLEAGQSVFIFLSATDPLGSVGVASMEMVDGGTPSSVGENSGTAIYQSVFYYLAGGGETGFTYRLTEANRTSANGAVFSGGLQSLPDDVSTSTGSTSSVTTSSVTPANAINLVVATGAWVANDYSSGPTNGFTRLTPTGGGLAWQEAAYKVQSSATAADTGWTLSAGISWATIIAVYSGA